MRKRKTDTRDPVRRRLESSGKCRERSSQMGLGWQREREDSEAEIAEKMAQVICAKPRMNWGKVLSRRANDQLVENEGVR